MDIYVHRNGKSSLTLEFAIKSCWAGRKDGSGSSRSTIALRFSALFMSSDGAWSRNTECEQGVALQSTDSVA